jgi:hypothetical protein
MMDKVRMDRTGKKKQAPAVKAKKYIPKWHIKFNLYQRS